MESKIEQIINNMQWLEAPVVEAIPLIVPIAPAEPEPIDVFHEALVETGRIASDTLKEFAVLENVGRVVLVKFEPAFKMDPIAPIVLNSTNAARRAAKAFIALLYEHHRYMFYRNATDAAARYVSACQWLEPYELVYLEKQLQLCVVDPLRKVSGAK